VISRIRRCPLYAIVIAAWALGTGCSRELSQLIVVVDTDLALVSEVDRIELRIEGASGTTTQSAPALGECLRLPVTATVFTRETPDQSVRLEAVALRGDTPVVTRHATTRFVSGETRMVPLRLVRGPCLAEQCRAGDACDDTSCETDDVPPESLPSWPGSPPPHDGPSGECMAVGPIASFYQVINSPAATLRDTTALAHHARFVTLLPSQRELARQLKAADPNVKVLVTFDLPYTLEGLDMYSGVPYASADPAWLMLDGAGARIQGSGRQWLMDYGHPGYQDAWARNVANEILAGEWDGVFAGYVSGKLSALWSGEPATGCQTQQYCDDDEARVAMRAALVEVTMKIHELTGKLVIGDVCCLDQETDIWLDWVDQLDGMQYRQFSHWDAGIYVDSDSGWWQYSLLLLEQTELHERYFLAASTSDRMDVAAARYGLATLMLGSQGRSSWWQQSPDTLGESNWFEDYDTALGLGAAVSASVQTLGIYRRDFEHGVVLVNPTTLPKDDIDLGPAAYSGSGLSHMTRVSLPETSALILTRDP